MIWVQPFQFQFIDCFFQLFSKIQLWNSKYLIMLANFLDLNLIQLLDFYSFNFVYFDLKNYHFLRNYAFYFVFSKFLGHLIFEGCLDPKILLDRLINHQESNQ